MVGYLNAEDSICFLGPAKRVAAWMLYLYMLCGEKAARLPCHLSILVTPEDYQ